MVVIPHSKHVVLSYGYTSTDYLSYFLTLLGLIGLVVLWRAKPVSVGPIAPMWRDELATDLDEVPVYDPRDPGWWVDPDDPPDVFGPPSPPGPSSPADTIDPPAPAPRGRRRRGRRRPPGTGVPDRSRCHHPGRRAPTGPARDRSVSGRRTLVRAIGLAAIAGWLMGLVRQRRVAHLRVRFDLGHRVARAASPGVVRLSVIIPAYQEADRIGDTIRRLHKDLADVSIDGGLEIVVVDDGSSDRTAFEADGAGADQVIVHAANRGKGAAVRSGVLAAHGRTVAFTDADLSYSPDHLLDLLEQVEVGLGRRGREPAPRRHDHARAGPPAARDRRPRRSTCSPAWSCSGATATPSAGSRRSARTWRS